MNGYTIAILLMLASASIGYGLGKQAMTPHPPISESVAVSDK